MCIFRRAAMRTFASVSVVAVIVVLSGGFARAQSGSGAAPHVAAAKAAAGTDQLALFNQLCVPPPAAAPRGQAAAPQPAAPQGPPPRSQWHADPAKVFDNLYFLGMTEYTAWAVTTSDGIIVIDPLFDYSVEDEVVN